MDSIGGKGSMKLLFFITILICGASAYRRHCVTGLFEDRRKALGWGGAFWGGLIGSSFGIAGYGGAISGMVPGAFIGYLVCSHLMLYGRHQQSGRADDMAHLSDLEQQPSESPEQRPHAFTILRCGGCNQRLRVPGGMLADIVCPKCRSNFRFKT